MSVDMKLERLLYRYGDRQDSCRQSFAAIILLTPIRSSCLSENGESNRLQCRAMPRHWSYALLILKSGFKSLEVQKDRAKNVIRSSFLLY